MDNQLLKTMAPSRVWGGALVFMVPALVLVTNIGVGLASYLILLTALWKFGACRAALARHWTEVRWVVLAFLFNFALVLVYFLLRPEQPASSLEKPLRMFCATSALAMVVAMRPPRQALWWGAIAGAVGAVVFLGYQRFVLGIERPGGLINPITFGDISLVLGMVALAATIDFRQARRPVLWPLLGGLSGVLTLVLSGTRGGWVALVMAAFMCMRLGHLARSRNVRLLLGAGLALAAALYFVPSTEMQARTQKGVDEVLAWYNGGEKFTSVGIRLELWKGAGMVIAEHPLVGVDPSTAKTLTEAWVKEGRLSNVIVGALHLHNDALQALASGGVFGLLALMGILGAPFAFFVRHARLANERGHTPNVAALAGMLVVIGYIGFGLTEMMFWSSKACYFYALMVFILMGLSLNQKEESGN
jgi:O-antigen ligase